MKSVNFAIISCRGSSQIKNALDSWKILTREIVVKMLHLLWSQEKEMCDFLSSKYGDYILYINTIIILYKSLVTICMHKILLCMHVSVMINVHSSIVGVPI